MSAPGPNYLKYLKSTISLPNGQKAIMNKFNAGTAHILMPITYISPNYLTVREMAIVASLTNFGNKVTILLHDSNIAAHKYVQGNEVAMAHVTGGGYIQHIIDQMYRLVSVFGGIKNNVRIVRASDLWIRIVGSYSYFFEFYNLLGKLKVRRTDFENGEYEEVYHILDKPFDTFAFYNYTNLIHSGFGNPEYLLLSNKNPGLYRLAASLLKENAETQNIFSTQAIPILQREDVQPGCYMDFSTIKTLIRSIDIEPDAFKTVYGSFIMPMYEFLSNFQEVDKQKNLNGFVDVSQFEIDMFNVLDNITKLLRVNTDGRPTELKIASAPQARQMRKLLASERISELLRYCDGEYTIAEIARKANMQLSNASTYINKLREAGILSPDKKPKIIVSNIIFPITTMVE